MGFRFVELRLDLSFGNEVILFMVFFGTSSFFIFGDGFKVKIWLILELFFGG